MSRAGRLIEASLVALVLLAGLAFRMLYLDAVPFWADEAESSINALTILQKGYPTDVYLGLPIYENTLVRKWPDNREYEFRDLSYSDNHLAIYHGWLPLYLMAGSFTLYGVHPDEDNGSRTVKHNLRDQKLRTRAARLPEAMVGVLFLLTVFIGGRLLYGRDAAWAGLIVGSIYPYHILVSSQARYYSLEIALTTACCVMLWLLLTRCGWKHVYLSAVAFVLLFYTHLLSFGVAVAVALLTAPLMIRRHSRALPKLAVFASLVVAGTLPWLIVTEFYRQQSYIPRAWDMLEMPEGLLHYPPLKTVYIVAGALVALLTAGVVLFRRGIPERVRAPITRLAPVLVFLCVWIGCGYSLFLRLMPAASFAPDRLNLVYWGPAFLLAAVVCASLARVVMPRFSVAAACAIMLALFFGTGHQVNFAPRSNGHTWRSIAGLFDRLNAMHLDSSSRLYAAPNDHLIYSFYSGLPVQSIGPVRKSFLDTYPGDIVYIDQATPFGDVPFTPESIRQEASREGQAISPETAERWSLLLRTRDYRETMLKDAGFSADAGLESLPPFAWNLLREERWRQQSSLRDSVDYPILRGFHIRTWLDWRTVFQYRFTDLAGHTGVHANYAGRLRGSTAVVLPSELVVYRSRWHPPGTGDGITFQFVQ